MKNILSILLSISLLFFLAGCSIDDYRTINLLGDFPWESVPDYLPYTIGDTVVMSSTGGEKISYKVKDVTIDFEKYNPAKYKLIACTCTSHEVAQKEVLMEKIVSQDDIKPGTISILWDVARLEYTLHTRITGVTFSSYQFYTYGNQVPDESYNAMFELLPDTLSFYESNSDLLTAQVVAGKGLVMYVDAHTNETWLLSE